MKWLIIKLIQTYQRLAPRELRDSCLFTPTCSEYMILAVNKFGVMKGVSKGFKRIIRCREPGGEIDYP